MRMQAAARMLSHGSTVWYSAAWPQNDVVEVKCCHAVTVRDTSVYEWALALQGSVAALRMGAKSVRECGSSSTSVLGVLGVDGLEQELFYSSTLLLEGIDSPTVRTLTTQRRIVLAGFFVIFARPVAQCI